MHTYPAPEKIHRTKEERREIDRLADMWHTNMPHSNGVFGVSYEYKMSVFKTTPDLEKRVEVLEKQVKEILQTIGKAPPPKRGRR